MFGWRRFWLFNGCLDLSSLRWLWLRSGCYFGNRNRRCGSAGRSFDDRLRRLSLRGDVIDHAQNEGENQSGKSWNRTISAARLWFGGNSRQRLGIGQISGVKNQQYAVHVAKALVVLVNKLTLGAPFHAISWIAGCLLGPAGCGSWSE